MSEFSANAMTRMREIAETARTPADCKKLLMKHVGKIEHDVFHSNVLVAQYIASAVSKGGIIFTDKKVQEDKYQGTIFLVIAMGKGAFKDDHIAKFNGDKLKIGDWVMAVAADGTAMEINGVPCRLYSDTRILMKVERPELYY